MKIEKIGKDIHKNRFSNRKNGQFDRFRFPKMEKCKIAEKTRTENLRKKEGSDILSRYSK